MKNQKLILGGVFTLPLFPAVILALDSFSDWPTVAGALISWYLVILTLIITLGFIIFGLFKTEEE